MTTTGGAMTRLAAWRAGGRVVPMPCSTGGGMTHRVWTRADGAGPWLTMVHGFPSSSFDLAEVSGGMAAERRVLCVDMVGFGESDRPREHVYSVDEQADAVAAAWAAHGVTETALFAHDLGATVAQELLWRSRSAEQAVRISSVVLANGGIYPDLHRPLPFQTALADPEQGAALSDAITEETMTATLRLTFSPAHQPTDDAMAAMWATVSRAEGQRNLHLLIRYMEERRRRERDWVGAIESATVPLGFVWGLLDPISGAHIAERIRERFPAAPARYLADVGHWPPIEAPSACIDVLREVDALTRSGAP